MEPTDHPRYPWLWDVPLGNVEFEAVLRGEATVPGLDADWAMLRLVEYAPYREIRRLLPLAQFLRRWPELRGRVRSQSRRKGMAFFAEWCGREDGVHG